MQRLFSGSKSKMRNQLLISLAIACGVGQSVLAIPHHETTGLDNPSIRFRPVKVSASSPLADRYIAAGDAAHLKNDEVTAKKYWLASLSVYEKNRGTPGKIGMFPALEHRLLDMYPVDWSKSPLKGAELVQAQEEQVSVYQRIAKMTQPYLFYGRNNTMAKLADMRLQQATKELKETKDKLQGTQAPSAK